MAGEPYKIVDRRSSSGWSNNNLYRAATQDTDRKAVSLNNYDTHRNVSAFGRITMATLGKKLYADFPMIRGAVLEQANLAAATFIPQFTGKNIAWGNVAEPWLNGWHQIFNYRSGPFDAEAYATNMIAAVLFDGDAGTLLTETASGYPMIQVIPGHRIRSRITGTVANVKVRDYQTSRWIDGQLIDTNLPTITEDPIEYEARFIDGVVVNDYGAALAYGIGSENTWDYEVTFVSSRNFFLTFIPEYADQLRGFSQIGQAAFDWLDVAEFRKFELMAQKIGASIAMVEKNEEGAIDPATAIAAPAPTSADSSGNATSLTREVFDGGMVRYFKAGSGSELVPFKNDRPGTGSMQFEDRVLRGAFAGMEWSIDFSLDPSKVGGAQARVVVEKINAVIGKRQRMIAKAFRRVDGYGLSKAIKLRLLPKDPEWYSWEYQGPGAITADKKYDSDVDIQELANRITSPQEVCGRRGVYWEDVQDRWLQAEKRFQERAAAMGVDLDQVKYGTSSFQNKQTEAPADAGQSGASNTGTTQDQ